MTVRHKVFDGAYLAAVAAPDAGLQVSTVIETTWDGDVLVGSSRERRGFDTTVDPAVTEAMLERAARADARASPRLAGRDAWAGLRPWLPDGLPALGPSRAVPGLWVATGHEGAGVGLGPISGELLAAALCGERPALDLTPFDPDRFRSRACGPSCHSAPSASDWRMTQPSAARSISAASAASGSGASLLRGHHRGDLLGHEPVGQRLQDLERVLGRRRALERRVEVGEQHVVGLDGLEAAGLEAAAVATRRSATAPCSAPARRSGRPCPARAVGEPSAVRASARSAW